MKITVTAITFPSMGSAKSERKEIEARYNYVAYEINSTPTPVDTFMSEACMVE